MTGRPDRSCTAAVSVQTPCGLLSCFWVTGVPIPSLPGHRFYHHTCQQRQYPEAVDALTCAGLPPAMNHHRRLFVTQTLADQAWLACHQSDTEGCH